MRKSESTITVTRPFAWGEQIAAQQEAIRLGQYQGIGRLDVLCFEYTETSNPRMAILGAQRNAQNRPAWPGIHLDWLNKGPRVAIGAGLVMGSSPEVLLPSVPFPLPPDSPDPTWIWSEAAPAPPMVPQRLEDRAMRIKGTHLLIIQPVVQIHWVLDNVLPGSSHREIHQVGADANGIHMAFIYDPDKQTGHLVGGRIV